MLVSRNKGLIDLRAIRTFGISAKVNDNPIGAFGSGSKYMIAIALRTGHEIALCRGKDRYTFHTKPVKSRGQKFDAVFMDGPDGEQEMPFTLDLGKRWEVWQAFREVHSNALDEKGETIQLPDKQFDSYRAAPDETAFLIRGRDFEQAYSERASIFLDSDALFVHGKLAIHPGRSEYVYYRGVRAMKLDRPSLYTYNALDLPSGLTEDRTIRYSSEVELALGNVICSCDRRDYLETVLIAPDYSHEGTINGLWCTTPSDTFIKVYNELRAKGHVVDLTDIANKAYLRVNKTLPLPPEIKPTRIQQLQLDKALAFCKKVGWDITFPIKIVPHAHGGLLALAESNTIVLTAGLFDQGTAAVVHGLLEEQLHLQHGFRDESREFQTFLFRQLIGMAQEVAGEAL